MLVRTLAPVMAQVVDRLVVGLDFVVGVISKYLATGLIQEEEVVK